MMEAEEDDEVLEADVEPEELEDEVLEADIEAEELPVELPPVGADEDEVLEAECEPEQCEAYALSVPPCDESEVRAEVEVAAEVEVEAEGEVEGEAEYAVVDVGAPSRQPHAKPQAKREPRAVAPPPPSNIWACCDRCEKWRRVTQAVDEDAWWECAMLGTRADGEAWSCNVTQEPLDDEEEEQEEEFKQATRLAGTWVQCDACTKWRSLPPGAAVGDGRWECSMNPRASHNTCHAPQEELGEEEEEEADAMVSAAEAAADDAIEAAEAAQRGLLERRGDLASASDAVAAAAAEEEAAAKRVA